MIRNKSKLTIKKSSLFLIGLVLGVTSLTLSDSQSVPIVAQQFPAKAKGFDIPKPNLPSIPKPNLPSIPKPNKCNLMCKTNTMYPQLIVGLKVAKASKLVTNQSQCEARTSNARDMTGLLVSAKAGPAAGVLARAFAGTCGKCACSDVF